MESSFVLAKRLWSIILVEYYMVREGISKRKLMVDLHLLMKRGKILGKKAITSLIYQHHYSNFSCRSTDVHVSSSAPREYEFSCSNSPAFPFHVSKRGNRRYNEERSVSALHKAIEIVSSDISEAVSPVTGFGLSPAPRVRQLRITDSPFPVREADVDCHVDREAEEFIEKFYEQLRLQKRMAALETRFYEEMMIAG